MFGKRHKEENIRLKAEIGELNETIEGLHEEIERHGEMTVLSVIHKLSSIDVDMMIHNISGDVEQIIVHSFMRSGNTDEEGMAGIEYGIELSVHKTDGSNAVLSRFPIYRGGDGCFISELSVSRRQNIVFLTNCVAEFMKKEFERGYSRTKKSVEVIHTEEWLDALLTVNKELNGEDNK